MIFTGIVAAILFETQQGPVSFKIESETDAVDPSKSVFLRVEAAHPGNVSVSLPDLRERTQGFSLAEEFAEEPLQQKDGSVVEAVNWRLVPEPCAEVYRIRPFAVEIDGGRDSFVGGPVYFRNPEPREPVTGAMEADPRKDLPPLSWRLAGIAAAALLALAAVVYGVVRLFRLTLRKVREHRMSPIERAWAELDRLLKKGLPGRGRYKDFYVELTMVVRRYIQRKYGIRAPHMTTDEFLRSAKPSDELRRFLESADMVKFAGVEATPEMADSATDSARSYLKSDEDAKHTILPVSVEAVAG